MGNSTVLRSGSVKLTLVCILCIIVPVTAVHAAIKLSPEDEKMIRMVMQRQTDEWNAGNIEKFMDTYLKSENLVFVGKNGPTYGWEATLNNYRKGYPDKDAMGKLNFDILKIDPIGRKAVFMIGRYHLTRKAGDMQGYFTLILKKFGKEWLIVSDHSSSSNN